MALRVFLAWVFGCAASLTAMAQTPAVGTVFRECSDCPDMVVLPAGRFTMGSTFSEAGHYDNEGPQRVVTLMRPFAAGRYEVTRGQFAAFVAESGYQLHGGNCWYLDGEDGKYKNDDALKNWRNPGYPQTDGHPVVCVSWIDAKAYADWLAKKTGKAYRLLSEAEWEYAARAGSSSSHPWGDDPDQTCRYGNILDPTFTRVVPPGKDRRWDQPANCDDGSAYTAKVGSYRRSASGLYDMIGNVWEWTEDCWNDTYTGAPTDGSAWKAGDCSLRVDRGGSWDYSPRYARSATRLRGGNGFRLNSLGFRLARSL